MPTGVIATGSKTIIDLSDGRSLSVYLGSNHPRTQIYDTNTTSFIPDWESNDTPLVITPTVYLDFRQVTDYSQEGVSIVWQRKISSSSNEADVENGQNDESVDDDTCALTVTENKLSTSGAKWITYIANVTYTDQSGIEVTARADISFSLVQTGANSKLVWISGEQAFKEVSSGGTITYTPSSITLKANMQNVNGVKWFYKGSGGDLVSIGTNTQITINPSQTPGSTYFNGDSATIIVQAANDSSITDTLTIYKLRDGVNGAAGASAYTAFLTNESVTFAGNSSGVVAGNTAVTSNVVVYYGTTKQTLSNEDIEVTGTPTGITSSKSDVSSGEVKITFTVNSSGSNLGSSGETSGTINVAITDPVSITLPIHWSKVNSGADGEDGEDAITFSVYSPDGNVFTNGVNEGGQNSLKLTTQFYKGSTDIKEDSNSFYTWYMYAPSDSSSVGGWKIVQVEKNGTSQNKGYEYTVSASDVVGTSTYRCKARIGNTSTTYYSDTITILDKTDNYQAEIESTGGEIFKNSIGESFLICRLFQNGQEVDPVKSTTYVKTEPSSGTTGSYIYVVNGNNTTLKKRTSSGWTTETSDSERTYKWYKRDKDGNAVTVGGNSVFATGKVIYVNQNDVDSKAVFTCEVE